MDSIVVPMSELRSYHLPNRRTSRSLFNHLPVIVQLTLNDIHLFRFDNGNGDVFILAGANDEIEIVVPADGDWYFYETKL